MIENTDGLKTLYSKLLIDVSLYKEDICTYAVQVGKKYHVAPKRLLFIGKATNGWVTKDREIEKLFNLNNPDRIMNRHDQMEWVHNLEGKKNTYNTNKSAFWRLVKNVSLEFLNKDDWYNYISWSNLYKVAPWEGGNPNNFLRKQQRETCISILNEELKILKPDAVLFLTSGWESFYLESIGLSESNNIVHTWTDYSSSYQKYNDILFIQSYHPQSKPEQEHVYALLEILSAVLYGHKTE